jgi:hypothetical protein
MQHFFYLFLSTFAYDFQLGQARFNCVHFVSLCRAWVLTS